MLTYCKYWIDTLQVHTLRLKNERAEVREDTSIAKRASTTFVNNSEEDNVKTSSKPNKKKVDKDDKKKDNKKDSKTDKKDTKDDEEIEYDADIFRHVLNESLFPTPDIGFTHDLN